MKKTLQVAWREILATIATKGTALRDKFLAAPGNDPMTAITSGHFNFNTINKHRKEFLYKTSL